MSFFQFWLECLKLGFTHAWGVFAIAEGSCIGLWFWLRWRHKKKAEGFNEGQHAADYTKSEGLVKSLARWSFILILPGAIVFLAPYLKYKDAESTRDSLKQELRRLREEDPFTKRALTLADNIEFSLTNPPVSIRPSRMYVDELNEVIPKLKNSGELERLFSNGNLSDSNEVRRLISALRRSAKGM